MLSTSKKSLQLSDNAIRSPFGNVSVRLSSRSVLRFSAQTGSTGPSRTSQTRSPSAQPLQQTLVMRWHTTITAAAAAAAANFGFCFPTYFSELMLGRLPKEKSLALLRQIFYQVGCLSAQWCRSFGHCCEVNQEQMLGKPTVTTRPTLCRCARSCASRQ